MEIWSYAIGIALEDEIEYESISKTILKCWMYKLVLNCRMCKLILKFPMFKCTVLSK